MYQDIKITDFTDPRFQEAFKQYFAEMNITVRNWDGMFQEMNHDEDRVNVAYLRLGENGETVGFIQFCEMDVKSWFFSMKAGFIREFWIAPSDRGMGHGRGLLRLTEETFAEMGIHYTILTTDTAPGFYEKNGYEKHTEITALNKDEVFVKRLC